MKVRPVKIFAIAILSLLFLIPIHAHAAVSDWMVGQTVRPMSTTDFASDAMKSSLRELKDTGANYVVLIIPYYTANRTSTEMRAGWNTPTDEALATAIDYAHGIGLKVMITPHLETDYIEWRGNINPSSEDRPAWFASYQKMLLHYGEIAQGHGVEDFALGAELLGMTNPYYDSKNTDHWKGMIKAMRGVFHGRLTYSANRDYEVDVIQFWGDLDYLGLSAYYDLYHASDNSVDELKKSWDAWRSGVIQPLHEQFQKDVVITEIGYRSIDQAYRDPWDWGRGGNYNEQDQANSYDALFSYWNDYPWMKGVMFWKFDIDAPAANSGNTDYTPQNKLAEQVMKKWLNGSGQTTTPPPTTTPPTTTPPPTTTTPPPDSGNANGNGGNPVTANSTLDVWWPGDGQWVSGLQPFKAMISYSDVSKYNMFWQVDGDRLNGMYDSSEDYPHKEAWVDVSTWNWRDNGPYSVTFVAQDKSGNVIFQKNVNIYVAH